jgi:hypothetical protein
MVARVHLRKLRGLDMARFMLDMSCDNAAFASDDDGDDARDAANEIARNAEVARILRAVADKLDQDMINGPCTDANGNNVGDWGFLGAETYE